MMQYNGTEPSPRGLGYCSRNERIGTVKRGRDGNLWRVQKRQNGTKAWTRCSQLRGGASQQSLKKRRREIEDQIKKHKAAKLLKKEVTKYIKQKGLEQTIKDLRTIKRKVRQKGDKIAVKAVDLWIMWIKNEIALKKQIERDIKALRAFMKK